MSHSNCRPAGRCLEKGARVVVRKAHVITNSKRQIEALGCCTYRFVLIGLLCLRASFFECSHIEVQSFASMNEPVEVLSWGKAALFGWAEIASKVSLTSYHWYDNLAGIRYLIIDA